MSWIPLGYIFQTELVELLVMKFFAAPVFRCDALQCLSEIACLEAEGNSAYEAVIEKLYVGTMNVLVSHIPMSANLTAGYGAANEEEQLLIQRLSLFLTNYFKVRAAPVVLRIASGSRGSCGLAACTSTTCAASNSHSTTPPWWPA